MDYSGNSPQKQESKLSPVYLEEIRRGMQLIEQRRAEYNFNHSSPVRPVYLPALPQLSQDDGITSPVKELICDDRLALNNYPSDVKCWPLLGLAAIRAKMGGAWRLWVLLRSLDTTGSGKVSRANMLAYLDSLGLDERQRRRWTAQAVEIGLICASRGVYYLAGLARGAAILGCDHVGRPARLSAGVLVRPGWRAYVWAAYLASLGDRPVSQLVKCQITGVDPRVQRNYQAAVPGEARRNFAETNYRPDQVAGLNECKGYHYFVSGGSVLQRLPDHRIVPLFVSSILPKGRSRKANKLLHGSSFVGRANQPSFRLFCESSRQVKATQRQVRKSNVPPWELPAEIFELQHAGRVSNLWSLVPAGVTAL